MSRAAVLGVALVLLAGACGGGDDGASDQVVTDASGPVWFDAPEDTSDQVLDDTVDSLRERFDALGLEPRRLDVDDGAIVIELPDDPNAAQTLDGIVQTAALVFQPVLSATGTDPDDQTYEMGPTALDGTNVDDAQADITGSEWVVHLVISTEGIDAFNAIAGSCFARAPDCPTGRLALVLDGDVISAPSIQTDRFEREQIQISGGFDEIEAKTLAAALRSGALPVGLTRRDAPAD